MQRRYFLNRALTLLFVLFAVSVVTFGLVGLAPGDPARTALAQEYGGNPPPAAVVEDFRGEHGLDQPLHAQYVDWATDALRGDLGNSFTNDRPVTELILEQLPATFILAAASMAVAVLVGVPAGILSAVHRDTWLDTVSRLFALFGLSMPNFWFGYLLIIVFALELGLFPVAGTGTLSHLVLPAVTLGLGSAAVLTRLVRTEVLEVLTEPYIQTAQSKGLHDRVVVYRHALRTALIPIITLVGLQFGYVLNGAVVVEIVFQRPGLGALLTDAIFARDYPVIQGVTLFAAGTFVLVNFLVDLSYAWIDPRISVSGESA